MRSMNSCATPPSGAPVIKVILVGSGEPLLRLHKRMSCAAAGMGLALDVVIHKDAETFDIPYAQTPAVLVNGKMVFYGLPRTEEIEDWLRHMYSSTNNS